MRTTDNAIDYVYSKLTAAGGLTCPVFKLSKPTRLALTEYAVINALPVTGLVMQRVHVNVNYYVADMEPGKADTDALTDGTAAILALLHQQDGSGTMIDFESQEFVRADTINMHYSNLRFYIKIVN